MGAGSPDQVPDPGEVRARAEEILAGREYQPDEPSLLDRFFEELGRRFGDLTGATGESSLVGVVALLVVAAGLVWLGVVLAGRVRTRSRSREEPEPVVVTAESDPGAAHWRAEADRHEAAGRWKEAVGCRYRALVSELMARDALDGQPGRTTGELRSQVALGCPPASPPFEQASDLFDLVWYAGTPAEREHNAEVARLTDDALAAAP